MKKTIRLAKNLQIKYASEFKTEHDTSLVPTMPIAENIQFPKPPLVPKEFKEESIDTVKPPKHQHLRPTLPSAKLEEISDSDKINTFKDLAMQLKFNAKDGTSIQLSSDQIDSILWIASSL